MSASSRPRSDSVASTTAAAHPSVRSRRASAASSDKLQSSARGDITGLLRVQREELSPDLDQIATRPEAPERHPWVTAGDQHQLRARSNLVDEKPENRAALLSRYDVHVVQYQHERVTLAELGGQERKGDLIDPGRPS